MAEIIVAVQNTTGSPIMGVDVEAPDYVAGFDHAALVTARRSRADGYDLRLRHTTYGMIRMGAVVGLNTSSCMVEFDLAASIAGGVTDSGYRIVFGNLGSQVNGAGSSSGFHVAGLSVTATVPAISLPAPAFPLGKDYVNDVVLLGNQRRSQNENARARFRLNWKNITAEDWYEIRAFENAAGSFSAPSWLGMTGTFRFSSAVSLTQSSRTGFHASCEIEEVVI